MTDKSFAPTAVHKNVTMFIWITSGNLMKIKWFSSKKLSGATPPICWSVSFLFFSAWLRVQIKHLITETPLLCCIFFILVSAHIKNKMLPELTSPPCSTCPFHTFPSMLHKCSHSLTSLFVGVTFSPTVNHSFHLREASLFLLAADPLIASICPSPPLLNYNQGIRTEKKNKRSSPTQRWDKSPGRVCVCVCVCVCLCCACGY